MIASFSREKKLSAPNNQPVSSSRPALHANILTFSHATNEQLVKLTLNPLGTLCRIPAAKLSEKEQKSLPAVPNEHPYYYLTFNKSTEGNVLKIDLRYHYGIARAWYNHHIRERLSPRVDAVQFNFLNDTQFWIADSTIKKTGTTAYQKFTLKYTADYETEEPGLLISYDGISYCSSLSVGEIMNNSSYEFDLTDKMIYSNRVITYSEVLQYAGSDLDMVYPKIYPRLRNHLKLPPTIRKNDKKLTNHWVMIKSFYDTYLNNPGFKSVIPHEGKWKPIPACRVNMLKNTRPTLLFGGNNTGNDCMKSLAAFGPYKMPPNLHIKVFLIFHRDDHNLANTLASNFNNTNGITSLRDLTHLPFQYIEKLNIEFTGTGNPADEIERKLKLSPLDPTASYYAFYISPYTPFETDPDLRKVYHCVTEMLLRRNIVAQTIERQKINTDAFKYFMANLGIAMIGKLGGIPWILNRKTSDGLVIGLGAYRSSEHKEKYIGSMFTINTQGLFRENDVVRAEDTWALAGKIQHAMIRLLDGNQKPNFLIIHYHKTITRKEFEPVERFLKNLNINIPVYLVGFFKSASKDLCAFDLVHPDQLPPNGTYIKTAPGKYLFYLNDRIDNSTVNKAPLPFKIEIKMMNANHSEQSRVVHGLFDHIHYLCYMHWRSVKQKKIPVTLSYPLLLSRRKPWFSNSELPAFAKEKLWFL